MCHRVAAAQISNSFDCRPVVVQEASFLKCESLKLKSSEASAKVEYSEFRSFSEARVFSQKLEKLQSQATLEFLAASEALLEPNGASLTVSFLHAGVAVCVKFCFKYKDIDIDREMKLLTQAIDAQRTVNLKLHAQKRLW